MTTAMTVRASVMRRLTAMARGGDLLTEEGSPDGQVPLQLHQDQCLQVVQLHRQADSTKDTEVMVRGSFLATPES